MNNPYRVIKRLAFVTGFCIVSCTTALAQQQSLYIYLQTENQQPFYVQIGDKVYSSSAIGHLVISGLQDNVCNFEVGFPQQTSRSQRFSIPMRNKDHGYQVAKSGTRDWSLYDLQTQETIKPLKGSGTSALLYGERKKDDAFATLMAAVVNDSSVLYTSIVKKDFETVPEVTAKTETNPDENKPVAKTEEKPAVTQQPADSERTEKKAETITVTNPPPQVPAVDSPKLIKNEPVRDTAIAVNKAADQPVTKDTEQVAKYDPKETPLSGSKKPAGKVVKIQEQTKDGEKKLVYVDSSESPADVVTVYIAEEKAAVQAQAPGQTPPSQPATNVAVTMVKPDISPETSKKDSAKGAATTAAPAKQDAIETVKKETPAKKDSVKTDETAAQPKQDVIETVKKEEKRVAPATLSKEEIAEKIKQETWKQATPDKKSTDTLTIILESKQMKPKSEAPKPLYQPKQVAQAEPVKQAATDTTTIRLAAPPKQDMAEVTKPQTDKPATDDKLAAKTEPVKPPVVEASKKAVTEPVIVKKDDNADAGAKQPKAVLESKPAADSAKKTTAEPVAAKKDTITTAVAKKEPEKKTSTLVMINSDCPRVATDNDVDKLRVKMLAENDWQKRVVIANKSFKTMCLYAKHIKGLTELFPTDETKYKFLEMAYPFAADTANFKQLYDLLSDAAYQTKFKTLVRLQ